MEESILISLFKRAGIIVLALIIFEQLQPFGKIIVLICIGYWLNSYALHLLSGLNLLFSMLVKACCGIFEYTMAWILKQ
jgi:hypothetical protein